MTTYGIIKDGELVNTAETTPEAKPVVYAPIPEFDQCTQYVIQSPPVDMGDHIHMGVEIRELENTDEPMGPEFPM